MRIFLFFRVGWMVWAICAVNDPSHKSCLIFLHVCTAPAMQCKAEGEQTWGKSEEGRRKKIIIRHYYTMISEWSIAGVLEHLTSSLHYSNFNIQPLFSCFFQCGMAKAFQKCEFYRIFIPNSPLPGQVVKGLSSPCYSLLRDWWFLLFLSCFNVLGSLCCLVRFGSN